MTLTGVGKHADFLAALWKWTTIIGGLIVGFLSYFGIKNYRELKKLSEQYSTEIEKLKADHAQFLKDTIANHVVMMSNTRVQISIDAVTEAERKANIAGIDEVEKDRLTNVAKNMITSAKENIEEVLKDNEPTDPAVGGFAYNIYGYIHYKMGEFSSAFAAAKKSLEFRPNNATTLYNASCYAAKLNFSSESVDYLKRAIEINHTFLQDAKSDSDFDEIRSQEFIDLVG